MTASTKFWNRTHSAGTEESQQCCLSLGRGGGAGRMIVVEKMLLKALKTCALCGAQFLPLKEELYTKANDMPADMFRGQTQWTPQCSRADTGGRAEGRHLR